jgi:methionyl-tRNA formyltransferase
MKVVICTGQELHHKSLCAQLALKHHVVGILHPPSRQTADRFTDLFTKAKKRELSLTITHGLGKIGRRKLEREFQQQVDPLFESMKKDSEYYDSELKPLVHYISDFRSTAATTLLKEIGPDVVVSLGGAIYPDIFINACPLMLNYHSGLSPVYNGNSTIWFTFANGHPHLCAGTLMLMNSKIDGGDILAHYLPEISATDNPLTLFRKVVKGSAILYDSFLTHLSVAGPQFSKAPQSPPLFYCKAVDWTPSHNAKIRQYVKRQLCSQYIRKSLFVEYWREPSDAVAAEAVHQTTTSLLWVKCS